MDASIASRLDAVQRKPLAASLRPERKPFAVEWKSQIGGAIDRALTLARISKQDASFRMGYPDQSAISRWIAGTERPQFDKLFGIDELKQPLVIALAELAGADVTTTVVIRRTA